MGHWEIVSVGEKEILKRGKKGVRETMSPVPSNSAPLSFGRPSHDGLGADHTLQMVGCPQKYACC